MRRTIGSHTQADPVSTIISVPHYIARRDFPPGVYVDRPCLFPRTRHYATTISALPGLSYDLHWCAVTADEHRLVSHDRDARNPQPGRYGEVRTSLVSGLMSAAIGPGRIFGDSRCS